MQLDSREREREHVRDMIRTYSQIHLTHKYPQHSSTIWPVWLNGWAFVIELSGCGFEYNCSYLNFRFCACFKQGVPWHPRNYRVWIHSETRTWHGKNLQSIVPYRKVLTTQLNHLASLAKWLSVRLWTKWLWFWVQLQSFKLQISRLPRARSSWHSGNYRVWSQYETRTWHDENIYKKELNNNF